MGRKFAMVLACVCLCAELTAQSQISSTAPEETVYVVETGTVIYDRHLSAGELRKFRRELEQETNRVKRICNLDKQQADKLEAALLRVRAHVQKEVFALEEAALRNPRLQGDESRQFQERLAEVNESLHQSYCKEGSLTAAILQSHLDDDQLKKLEQATLDEFVSALAGSELNWDDSLTKTIRSHLEGVISLRKEILIDHQLLLDALTEEYLSQVLTDKQAERFSMFRHVSDRAHYFILNIRH